MKYYCDVARHLVCIPFSIENLHLMASDLKLDRHWFHNHSSHPHYDIPKRRIKEITDKCTVVRPRDIIAITKGEYVG